MSNNPATSSASLWGLSPAGAAGLRRAREGDVEAFGIVCLELEAPLWRHAVMLCGDHGIAEDLAQETLITAWRRLDRFDGSCRFLTWATGILLNLHRNTARKNRRRPETDRSLGESARHESADTGHGSPSAHIADPAQGPAERLLASERSSLLRTCLDCLPEEQRSVVHLRFFAGATLAEIAAVLGCAEGTVKSRLFHAVKKLARMPQLRDGFAALNVEILK